MVIVMAIKNNYSKTVLLQLYSKGVTDPCGDQGFQDFTVRCDQSDQIEFRQDCSASAGIKTSGKNGSIRHHICLVQ